MPFRDEKKKRKIKDNKFFVEGKGLGGNYLQNYMNTKNEIKNKYKRN